MGYSESFKLKVVGEYELGGITVHQLQKKYKIPGNATIGKWVKKYGSSSIISAPVKKDTTVCISEKLGNIELKRELEFARLKIAALEVLVDASSKHTGIDLKKKLVASRRSA